MNRRDRHDQAEGVHLKLAAELSKEWGPPLPYDAYPLMNLKFLGDALDHWKGSLLQWMRTEKLLVDLKVDLMATEATNWRVTVCELIES